MRRLAYRLPTVLQVDPDSVILFHEDGVSQLTRPGNDLPYTPLFTFTAAERIWALVDMSPALQDPAAILKYDSPFFVVNASSPRSEDREWFWRVYHDMFYMNPWSISELLQAYVGMVSEGLQLSVFFTAVRSLVIISPPGSSYRICTTSSAHYLPGIWSDLLKRHENMRMSSSEQSVTSNPANYQISSKTQHSTRPPSTSPL